MSVTKTKPVLKKSKAPEPKIVGPVVQVPDYTIVHTAKQTAIFLNELESVIKEINESDEPRVVPQSLLLALNQAVTMSKSLDKFWEKNGEPFLLDMKNSGASFEAGRATITFPISDRRSPKWKEEAVRLARQAFERDGEPFNEEQYCELMIAAAPPSGKVSAKITMADAQQE